MKTKYLSLYFALLMTLSCKGQSENTTENITEQTKVEAQLFNADELLERVKFLSLDSLEGRRTGEKGGLIARDYVVSQFKKHEISPFLTEYTQPFTFESRRNKKTYEAANVLGLIKGTDKSDTYIVISAHYDHVGINKGEIYNGADDDASGTSALFSMAEYFKNNPPKHSVILAAFDAEELGLQGAKYFLEANTLSKDQIVLDINLDMIGRNDNNELYVVGTNIYTKLQPAITDLKLPENFKLLTGHDGLDDKQNWVSSSDHGPFHKQEIPFLYFGVEDHKDYHKPTDDFESIQPEFYVKAVTTIISVFEKVDDMSFH